MSGSLMLRRAVFLDRDGTISKEKNYLHKIEDFEFIGGVVSALKKLQGAGFLLVVVTNQSGVARGFFSIETVQRLHEHMSHLLKGYGVSIDGIYICPHHPKRGNAPYKVECDCRKGKPGMILRAADDLGIDLSRSFMIGDKLTDIEAGGAAGCHSLLVRTGYGKALELPAEIRCEADFPTLSEAVDYILGTVME